LVNRVESGVPILVYPTGTSNLLSGQLGVSTAPDLVVNTLKAGRLRHLDAARASGRLFLLMLSCGFDAEVVHKVHTLRKSCPEGHITYWSYLKPILDSIRSYDYPEIRIHCVGPDGESQAPIATRWAFALNLPPYGWGISLAPRADGLDGLLDLVTFEHGSLWHGLLYAAAMQVGQHERLPDCRCQRVRRLRIESDRPVSYQLDGDPGGSLPVDVEVLPARATFLVPPE
jgi:diacylglycerol kinase family enzyme